MKAKEFYKSTALMSDEFLKDAHFSFERMCQFAELYAESLENKLDDYWLCKRDLRMEDGELSFMEGNYYKHGDVCLIDEQGDEHILAEWIEDFDPPKSRWISVDDRLPDPDKKVLWCMDDGYIFIDEIDHDNDWANFRERYETLFLNITISEITHWRELPKLPE